MEMEMSYLNLDVNWEENGLPKANENVDYNLPRYTKGSGRKKTTRAERRKATAHHKAKNIRIAKAKGYELDKCPAPDKAGKRNVLSDTYSSRGHCKAWYSDSIKGTEQKKIAKKEIKNFPNDIVDWEELEWWEEYGDYFYRPYFDKGDYYLCMKNIHASMNTNLIASCSTPVKEVLFNCLLNN